MNLIKLETVDSTNEYLKSLLAPSLENFTTIVTDEQTSGRGQHGRKWQSLKGNLLCSILYRPFRSSNLEDITLLAVRTIIQALDVDQLTIKPPNDILHNNAKICGILCEMITISEENYIIIGVGLNTNISPQNIDQPATNLREITNMPQNNMVILGKIVEKLKTNLAKFEENPHI